MSAHLFICSQPEKTIDFLEKELATKVQANPDCVQINQEAQSIKIKQIRAIATQTAFRPNQQPYKTFVLYHFEKTTIPAQNAFLKTLEEHPDYIQFVLHCTTVNGILETIQSRCHVTLDYTAPQSGTKQDETLNTFSAVWNTIQSGSYADIIELVGDYKDRDDAIAFIKKLLIFIHQQNQKTATAPFVYALEVLPICISQLEQNSNVLLTIENHLFAIKSRF